MNSFVFDKLLNTIMKEMRVGLYMRDRGPSLPLSRLNRATAPYLRWVSSKLGSISSGIWMDEFQLSEFEDEEWVEAKLDACFSLREALDNNSNTPSFNSQDMEISRYILEGIHLAVDLSIIVRRGIEVFNLLERIVPMVTLMRCHQQNIDPTLVLKDLAMAINQSITSRKLGLCVGKQFANNLEQTFIVADNSFEAGLLDGLFAINQGIVEPMDVVIYLGAGGEAAC